MKKILIALTVAALAMTSFACNKDKKETNTAVVEASAAPQSAAEVLQQVEANYQRNDGNATDPATALTCKVVVISGSNGSYSIQKAEQKTSGSCDFAALKGSLAAAGSLSAAQADSIVNTLAANPNLPASAKDKWDCTSLNIKTNIRKAGVQDCADGTGNGAAEAAAIAKVLGL